LYVIQENTFKVNVYNVTIFNSVLLAFIFYLSICLSVCLVLSIYVFSQLSSVVFLSVNYVSFCFSEKQCFHYETFQKWGLESAQHIFNDEVAAVRGCVGLVGAETCC